MSQSDNHTTLVRAILRYAKAQPRTYAIPLHGSIYLPAGTPDVLVVSRGLATLIEVKTGGARVKPVQVRQMQLWAGAGAIVEIVRSLDEAKALLDRPVGLSAVVAKIRNNARIYQQRKLP